MMRSHSDGVTPSAAMPNFMADRGARLVDAGYSILPIAPGAKCPGQYSNSNGWRGLTDWVRFCDRQPTALELEIWSGWPGCGIGIPGGRAVGIDIDVLNSDVALQIEALAQAELGATPAIRIGRNPKRLLVYRAKAVFQKFALHPIEVIAHGGQFVAHAIHPDTGEPYRWPVEDLSEIELASLPTVTEESCRRFLDAAIRLVPPELRQSQLGPDRHAEYYYAPGGNLHGTLPAVGAALSFIANDDLPYDDWIRIGMALKGGLGEAGWPLFQAWSGSSSKDKPETTAKAWRSLKPNRIGAGTIYGYALERGWLPDSDMILNGALAEVVAKPVHPAASFLARIEAEIATEAATKAQEATLAKTPNDTVAIADEVAGNATDGLSSSGRTDVAALVATAPGLLGQITQWMISTAVSPQPFLSLGAALCVLGTAMGRRYRLNQPDTRSNLYVIALADSTSGKDHPRKCARRLLIEAGLGQHLGGETIASGSGLLASVAKHPVRLFQIDEFGHFVTAVLDPHSHAHHRREIMTQLTVLSTSATETVIGTEYANQEERPRIDICEPCVCVYASTVPHVFWGAMQHGNIADGSLPRFLIFQTERNFPDEQDPHSIDDGLHQLVPVLQSVAAGDGTLASSMAPCVRPILLTVPFNTEAAKLDQALRCRQLELKRQHEGTPFAAIVGRMREHTRRVALIAAVAVDHVQPVVTADVYRWAEALVEHCITTVIDQAKRFVADSAHEAMSKRVLEVIRRAGGWLDGNALTQRIRFLPRKARAEIIAELAEAGLVEVRQEGTLTKPRQLVRAAPE